MTERPGNIMGEGRGTGDGQSQSEEDALPDVQTCTEWTKFEVSFLAHTNNC